MANKKNYYYVLVYTNEGPKFVTKVNYGNKTAEWNKLEKPLEMNKTQAENLVYGLTLNFTTSFLITIPYELETQCYRYENGHFEWKENEVENTP